MVTKKMLCFRFDLPLGCMQTIAFTFSRLFIMFQKLLPGFDIFCLDQKIKPKSAVEHSSSLKRFCFQTIHFNNFLPIRLYPHTALAVLLL